MPNQRYYYEILELPPGASLDEVKEAYRDLAQVWHPDRFANSPRLQQKALEKMKEINEAYDFLKSYQPPAARPEPPPRRPAPAQPEPPRSAPAGAAQERRTYSYPGSARSPNSQASGDEIRCMRGHTDIVSSVAYSPSGKLIISGSYDKTVRVWQTGTGLEKLWFLGHKSAVTSVAFAPDSRGALSGGMDKSVFLRDCDTKKEIQYFYAAAVVECVAISPDNRYVVSGTVGSGAQLWEVSSGRELRKFSVGGFVSSACFSPLGNRVAVGTSDGEVTVFDRTDGSPLSSFRVMRDGSGQMIHAVRFFRDGAVMLTASPHLLQLWQTKSGVETGRIEIGQSALTCADLAPDGTKVVTGHVDCTVQIWNIASGKPIHVYRGHTEAVKAVAYGPDGQSVASGGFDKTLRMWRVPD
jgi:WD40 repeat protein